MNNSRTKRIPQIILGQSLVSAIILIIAGYLIVYSLGYKINLSARKIVQTGLIVLSIEPKPDQIVINGAPQDAKNDISASLIPGFYSVQVKKEGYADWTMRSEVQPGLVNFYKYIELFRTSPVLHQLTDQKKIDYVNSPSNSLVLNAPKGLRSNEYEIWLNDNLVTRFSNPITQVSWYPDFHHIMYQQNNEIKIIGDDGFNSTTLVTLPTSSQAKFVLAEKNTELDISQDEKYYSAQIQ